MDIIGIILVGGYYVFFFKQKTAYEIRLSLVGSENVYKRQVCIHV